jgi:hypothetical protein
VGAIIETLDDGIAEPVSLENGKAAWGGDESNPF